MNKEVSRVNRRRHEVVGASEFKRQPWTKQESKLIISTSLFDPHAISLLGQLSQSHTLNDQDNHKTTPNTQQPRCQIRTRPTTVLRPSSTSIAHPSWTRYLAHDPHLLNTQHLSPRDPHRYLLDLLLSLHSIPLLEKLLRHTRLPSPEQRHLHPFLHTRRSHSNLSSPLFLHETLLPRQRLRYHKTPRGNLPGRRTIASHRPRIQKALVHSNLSHT